MSELKQPPEVKGRVALWRVFKISRELSAKQKQFVRTLKIAEARPLNEWLRFFRMLGTLDRYGDKARSFAGGWAIGGFVIIFVSIVANAPFEFKSPGVRAITAGTGMLGLLCVLGLGSLYFFLKERDIPNTLRRFLLPVFMLLKDDAHRKSPPFVELDLTKAEHPDRSLRAWTGELTQAQRNRGIQKETFEIFSHTWARASIRLVDGSILKWQIVDVIRRRHRRKRNARGKVKYKTKYKIKRIVRAELRPLKSQYAVAASDASVELVREDERRAVLRMSRRIDYTETSLENLYDRDLVAPFLEVIGGLMNSLDRRQAG